MRTSICLTGLIAGLLVTAGGFWQAAGAADNASGATVAKTAAPSGAITLVGRGNRAAEVGKDGSITDVTPDRLVLRNRGRRVSVAVEPPAAPNTVKPAEETPKAGEEAANETAKAEGEKAVQEALKEADVESVEEMRKSRSMWFFDENGRVMTNEELDRRLANKDLSGIKAVNDDRDEWTPRSSK